MYTGVRGYGKPSGGIKAQWMWHAGLEVMHRIVISPQFLLGWSQSSSCTLSEVWHQHKNNNNLLHAWINVTLRGRNWHRVNKKTTKKQRKQQTGKKEDEKRQLEIDVHESHRCQRRNRDGWSCTVSLHHTSGLPHPYLHMQTTGLNLKENQISLVSHSKQTALYKSSLSSCLQCCTFCHAVPHCVCILWNTPVCADIFLHWVIVSEVEGKWIPAVHLQGLADTTEDLI